MNGQQTADSSRAASGNGQDSDPFGCPNCGETQRISQNDVVPARAQMIGFDDDGQPIWSGNTEVLWNGQMQDPDRPRFYCHGCGNEFEEPERQ